MSYGSKEEGGLLNNPRSQIRNLFCAAPTTFYKKNDLRSKKKPVSTNMSTKNTHYTKAACNILFHYFRNSFSISFIALALYQVKSFL